MAKLILDELLIKEARDLAKTIAFDIQKMIDQHTTDSIERTVLRFLGIQGINKFDVPLVNVVIDHIKTHADLSKGVAHYIAYAMYEHQRTPQQIAENIAEGSLSFTLYSDKEKCPYIEDLMPYMFDTIQTINKQKNVRKQKLKEDQKSSLPEKYVIVATGNIYEDIKQAISAAEKGAEIIAVIRTTGQSLLDYVPHGATTEGFGGTYATQENFRLMREALDAYTAKTGRYIKLVNYASGLCMPEIAAIGAVERLDMMLNDSLYGIIFRDINMKRTFIDQYFSRLIGAYADIVINTGEDNYLTTSDAYEQAHTVLASQLINEQFAHLAFMKASLMGLGHAYEIDPDIENSFLFELAQAELSKAVFPKAPLKYMPPTKHMTGDIFRGLVLNTLFNITSVTTKQSIHLLGMLTEAIHTPFISDRAIALENANLVDRACKDFGNEITYTPDGIIATRARTVLKNAHNLLKEISDEGLFKTLEKGTFAGVSRHPKQGKGLDGVYTKHQDYQNPVMDYLLKLLKEENHVES